MVLGIWLGLIIAVLGESNAHPQQTSPSEICASGRPNPAPPTKKGWGVIGYVLRGEVDKDSPLVPHIEAFKKQGYRFAAVEIDGKSLLFVTAPPGEAQSFEAAMKQVRELCALEEGGQLQIIGVNYDTEESRREMARVNRSYLKLEEKLRIIHAKEARDSARRRMQARKSFPQLDEVQAILTVDWEQYSYHLGMESMKFGRVRDVSKCRRRGSWFTCVIGVTATSDRGPEYEQATLGFRRDENAALHIDAPANEELVLH